MTDTTDIKALRERLISADSVEELHSFAIYLIDQLEAERQRADVAEKERDRIDRRNAEMNSTLERWAVERAENANEIAELKGDQVPVAVMDIQHGRADGNLFAVTLTRAGHALKDDAYELFTAPQKPVVLPSSEDCLSCDRNYVDGLKAGWNFHEEGDNQGFIDSIERVQKDMREARKEQGKDDA